MFESIPDYRKILLLIFLIQNDRGLLKKCGLSKKDVDRLDLQFRNILMEENYENLDYIKNEEESIIENTLNE